MTITKQRISPCLWFDTQAEEAAQYDTAILKAQQCGWLKDKYGLSWQVVPPMDEFFARDENSPGAARAMEAMLKMKKIDIAELRRYVSAYTVLGNQSAFSAVMESV
ncbi:MAG TPA: VOC family protein [Gemmatimonadaceae bacterium]|nr:VOC family protein [Gemmatimonadaceae bacterium]